MDVHIIAATNKNLLRAVKEGHFREDLYYRISVFPVTLPPLRERKEDIPLLITYFIDKFNKETGKSINNIAPQAMKVFMNYFYPGNIRELRNIIEHAFVCSRGNTILPEHLPKELIYAEERLEIAPEGSSLNRVEKEWILSVLEKSMWRYQEAAKTLGISRTTLWRKLKAYGLTPEKSRVH